MIGKGMNTYIIRYSMPGSQYIELFNCECDSYKEAEEMLEGAYPSAILVNIEEVNGPIYETNH